jgi:TPR repeat protein
VEGSGAKVDKGKAMEYFRQGAALGEPHAQYKMAKYYMSGAAAEGPADYQKAI